MIKQRGENSTHKIRVAVFNQGFKNDFSPQTYYMSISVGTFQRII